jgi:hypothetical protein
VDSADVKCGRARLRPAALTSFGVTDGRWCKWPTAPSIETKSFLQSDKCSYLCSLLHAVLSDSFKICSNHLAKRVDICSAIRKRCIREVALAHVGIGNGGGALFEGRKGSSEWRNANLEVGQASRPSLPCNCLLPSPPFHLNQGQRAGTHPHTRWTFLDLIELAPAVEEGAMSLPGLAAAVERFNPCCGG